MGKRSQSSSAIRKSVADWKPPHGSLGADRRNWIRAHLPISFRAGILARVSRRSCSHHMHDGCRCSGGIPLPTEKRRIESDFSSGTAFIPTFRKPLVSVVVGFLTPIRLPRFIHASHFRSITVTTLGRLCAPVRRRSRTSTMPIRRARHIPTAIILISSISDIDYICLIDGAVRSIFLS